MQYNASSLDLDYKKHNLDSPSIFSAIIDVTESVYSDFNKFKQSRALEEKLINATKPNLTTKIK